jgi:tRNA threonylcarbamoyladenosine biosynthesis protein TsaE
VKRSVTTLVTRSPLETQAAGACVGRGLPIPSVILLLGPLGSGKTTLARGLAKGLGLRDASLVSSPSFSLINVYQGVCPIYHVDLYRLTGKRDFDTVGLDEFLGSRGVTIVEWGERLQIPVEPAVVVELSDEGDDVRRLRITASHELSKTLRSISCGHKPKADA